MKTTVVGSGNTDASRNKNRNITSRLYRLFDHFFVHEKVRLNKLCIKKFYLFDQAFSAFRADENNVKNINAVQM